MKVYGPVSSQDKGLDNRKSAKTNAAASGVENVGAIFRELPPGDPGPNMDRRLAAFPELSTIVERVCGYAWR